MFKNSSDSSLTTYADSDFAEYNYRRSTCASMHTSFITPINFKSRKYPTIAISTGEAENVAASQELQDIFCLLKIRTDFQQTSPDATPFFVDNNGRILIARHIVKNKRGKHFEIKYHHIYHNINESNIKYTEYRQLKIFLTFLQNLFPLFDTRS